MHNALLITPSSERGTSEISFTHTPQTNTTTAAFASSFAPPVTTHNPGLSPAWLTVNFPGGRAF